MAQRPENEVCDRGAVLLSRQERAQNRLQGVTVTVTVTVTARLRVTVTVRVRVLQARTQAFGMTARIWMMLAALKALRLILLFLNQFLLINKICKPRL